VLDCGRSICTEFTRERRLHGEAAATAAAAARQPVAIDAGLAEHIDIATGEWRTNPQLDAYVRQQNAELLAKSADLVATVPELLRQLQPHPHQPQIGNAWPLSAPWRNWRST
jgi:hypothetical protein